MPTPSINSISTVVVPVSQILMSQRSSIGASSLRSLTVPPADSAYDAIRIHYANEDASESRIHERYRDSHGTSNESGPTSVAKEHKGHRSEAQIVDTSPEPDESLEKLSEDTFVDGDLQESCQTTINKLKKHRVLFAVSTLALAIALLGTLAGLIFLAATWPRKGHGKSADGVPLSDVPVPTLREPAILAMKFDTISNTDADISNAFADHSLYQSFYGVTYDGAATSNCSVIDLQHSITRDIALLSRITQRVRIVNDRCNLTDRVLNAIMNIKVNVAIVLSIKASEWSTESNRIYRTLGSYPEMLFDSVDIESDDTPAVAYRAYADLESFLKKKENCKISVRLVDPTEQQPNPLAFANDPNTTLSWVISDKARLVYTNLVSPSETSEKARAMAVWVCGVADYLDPEVAWFWSSAFDNDSGVTNGIFTANRVLKPAGLPRCIEYA